MMRIPKRMTLAAILVGVLASLSACNPATQTASGQMSAEAEFLQARQNYARAAQRLVSQAKPITNRDALARKLKLSASRFGVIKTGSGAGGTVMAFDQGADCKMGHCSCYGDNDCNQMFSGICRSESTDGYCEGSGDTTICTCQYSTGGDDDETPTPTEPG